MNFTAASEPGHSMEDDIVETEADSNRFGILDRLSSNGEAIEEPVNPGEIIRSLEFNLTCCLEKLPNLNDFMMHVATRENEFESFASESDYISDDFAERAMEFDLFSGILDSEVNEMDDFMIHIQIEINNVHEMISSNTLSEEIFVEIQGKLRNCEEYFKQSQDQISEIQEQSARFQTTLSRFYDENWNDEKGAKVSDDSQVANSNAKIKMQTAEQQREVLIMLEKTMGRELDLENKLNESKQIEEELNLRLRSSQQDMYSMEKEMEDVLEKCFKTDNASKVFEGVSQELLGRIQILQFNLKGSIHREGELRSKLEETETHLDKVKSEFFDSNEKINLLEKQLRGFDIRLQQEVASSEASQEKQALLNSTIADMESLIRDLKVKVSKEETRADSAEERCIVLSEAQAEMNEEIGFLRGRLYCLEASLEEAEETKRSTSKDIGFQTKIITDLVMRLAIERDRLHKQISSLTMENKLLVVKLQLNDGKKSKEFACENGGERGKEASPKVSEIEEIRKSVDPNEAADCEMEFETARRIDAGALSLKQAILAGLIFLVSIGVYFFAQQDHFKE